ncbi:element excision factor XisH family protein [Stenomitos frigidus]|uniref:XisH protein n=1 Tax=Stenomitos frigidus ULC18 TaxID=2107698 RepID=A0A2T1DXF0_9CYAN|nr:element excision factor XisH family protein [Stenomitos frigidus]PSB25178.1 hypothetical protein C7B82_24240 [Stenomitos frigidus ULC18]
MPPRDSTHPLIKKALVKEGWEITAGQYVLYQMLLRQVDPGRDLYLAIADRTYDEIFSEPIGELVIRELPLKLMIVNVEAVEVKQWILPEAIERL